MLAILLLLLCLWWHVNASTEEFDNTARCYARRLIWPLCENNAYPDIQRRAYFIQIHHCPRPIKQAIPSASIAAKSYDLRNFRVDELSQAYLKSLLQWPKAILNARDSLLRQVTKINMINKANETTEKIYQSQFLRANRNIAKSCDIASKAKRNPVESRVRQAGNASGNFYRVPLHEKNYKVR